MEQVSLSDIELYYSTEKVIDNLMIITGEECHHIKDVMRHKLGDEIYVTNGKGSIYKVRVEKIEKSEVAGSIIEENQFQNKFDKVVFCIPRLKSTERFEFALEKCVELGITNFIVFESSRTIAKGAKIERWQKVLLSAMKQSLRAWLPKISYVKSFKELMKLDCKKVLFDQHAEISINDFLKSHYSLLNTEYYFIFGPEGGLTEEECRVKNVECRIKLTENRLRSETAIITAASLLVNNLK